SPASASANNRPALPDQQGFAHCNSALLTTLALSDSTGAGPVLPVFLQDRPFWGRCNSSAEPCGKPSLNPGDNPVAKLGVNSSVHNSPFHPQDTRSLPSASTQERHSLVLRCRPYEKRRQATYPQNVV
ncbi:TPA: hypothetical protein ACQJWO_005982, partial [Klebsiella pneumoniae]